MPIVKLDDSHIYPRESKALIDWGEYIMSINNPGPNERQDPVTGIWGTRCQALGNMYATRKDEDYTPRKSFDDTDACDEMLDCVFMLDLADRMVLCGYYMSFKRDLRECKKQIPSNPESNVKFRFTSRTALVDAIDRATYRAEAMYRELYHEIQVKRMRRKFERLRLIERNAAKRLNKIL